MFCLMCNIQLFCFMSELRGENIIVLFSARKMTQWDFLPDKYEFTEKFLSDF